LDHLEDLLSSLLVLAWMVEARDPYTGGHLWRVSRMSRLLASAARLTDVEVARVAIGGFLHDLGKVGVPDAILRKPDRLTPEEYEVIKTHPEVGMRMLAGHPLAGLVRSAILAHHEMPDGKGYPRGLVGEDVPLHARIVGICDAFDAMTSHRPYRAGMPIHRALGIIEDNLGRQFDQAHGQIFLELGRQGSLDHIVRHSDEGIPLQDCPMCGPTVVLRRESVPGEHVYCRNCSTEFLVAGTEGGFAIAATGRKGSARDLEPMADTVLIGRFVAESAQRVAFPDLLALD
jgi:HD-GYP domain-containing protein (c-di-GMP phosphodiesterase class II)